MPANGVQVRAAIWTWVDQRAVGSPELLFTECHRRHQCRWRMWKQGHQVVQSPEGARLAIVPISHNRQG